MKNMLPSRLLTTLLLALIHPAVAAADTAEVAPAPPGDASVEGPALTPRAAVERFLELARDGRDREASTLLDIAPAQRPSAEELARHLKSVLDRRLWIELQEVSDAPEGRQGDGLPENLDELGRVPGSAGQLEPVRLVRLEAGGAKAWRFARSTVDRIPVWYARLPGRWALDRLPAPLLRAGPMDLPWWQWLALLAIAPVAWALGALLGRISRAGLRQFTRRTASTWDDDLVERLGGPLTLAWTLAAAGLLLSRLDLSQPIQVGTDRVLRSGILVVVFWAMLRAVDVSANALAQAPWASARPGSRSLLSIAGRIAKVVVVALAVVAALSEFGYPVASLLAGLGLGGLAFALAAQKTVENLFGALSIGLDQPIREGDFIKVEEMVGTVEAIGLRSTRIRTLDRTLVSIPNGRLADMRLESYTARDRIRLACDLGLVYETTEGQMREVLAGLEAVLRAHPLIWPDAVVVRFKQFGAFSLDIEIMAWFQTSGLGPVPGHPPGGAPSVHGRGPGRRHLHGLPDPDAASHARRRSRAGRLARSRPALMAIGADATPPAGPAIGRSPSLRARLREALSLLGISHLLLGIHDPAFPSLDDEEIGRGSPGSAGAADFLELVASLGFNGVQLGPQGQTAAQDPSPYNGTLFSRDPLSLALQPLTTPEQGRLLRPETLATLVEGAPRRRDRADHLRAERAVQVAIGEVQATFRRERARGGDGTVGRLAGALEAFRSASAGWLLRDGLYEVLMRERGGRGWRAWRGEETLDARLLAPRPGEEGAMAQRRLALEARHADALEDHALVQFLLHEQHRRLRERARGLGLALFGDLQVGMSDRDEWAAQGFLLQGWWLGAPPSRTNPEGQPWQFPVLDPRRYAEDDGAGGSRAGPAARFLDDRVGKMLSEFDGLRIDHPHGLVCPWVYRAGGDPAEAVHDGVRLFDAPEVPDLAALAIPRPEQLDLSRPRHDDGRVRWLDEEQVDRYAALFRIIMEAMRREGRGVDEVACEVLSTMPYPLRRVVERYGLGRFRITQKADLDRVDDVYRPENARPEDWILMGNHDTLPIRAVAAAWRARGTAGRRAEALATRLLAPGEDREAFVRRVSGDIGELAQASLADLFVGPARNVIISFTDLLGESEPFNQPGTVSGENWSLRVPPDFRQAFAARLATGQALDIPRALARALRSRGEPFVSDHRELILALQRGSSRPDPA